MIHFMKGLFDCYFKLAEVRGVYVWEMQEGKKTRWQVLVDIGRRMLVLGRYDEKEQANARMMSVLREVDVYLEEEANR